MPAAVGTNVHHAVVSMLLAVRSRLAALDVEAWILRAGHMDTPSHSQRKLQRRCNVWGRLEKDVVRATRFSC